MRNNISLTETRKKKKDLFRNTLDDFIFQSQEQNFSSSISKLN